MTDTAIPEDAAFKLDAGGVRQGLARAGIGIGGYYYGETFYNWGGFDQGGEYDGVLELYINADMKKLGFWRGLCFLANGYQIHGNSITAANIGSLMPVSNLEATDATRLFEIWFEQHLFNDKVTVKIGQLAADAEFLISEGGGYLLERHLGLAFDHRSRPAERRARLSLATPGVRVAINPNEKLGLMVGVYNGDPAPPCASEDPQRCNDHGLDFELDDDPLLMVEGVYRYNQKGRLPGTVKIGGWNHFGTFEDQRFDSGGALIAVTAMTEGRSITIGASTASSISLSGACREARSRKASASLPASSARHEDRNLIDFYADGGVTFTGMIPGRPDDAFAVGFAYTNISDRVSAFDVDFGEPVPRNYEALIEICYTYQINPGWSLQPNFQYIFQPGGNVAGVEDATVVGARTTIGF